MTGGSAGPGRADTGLLWSITWCGSFVATSVAISAAPDFNTLLTTYC